VREELKKVVRYCNESQCLP